MIVPGDQFLNRKAKKPIALLTGSLHGDLLLMHIGTSSSDFPHLKSRDHIQVVARKLYCELRDRQLKIGGDDPTVTFDRYGWRHITRPDRPQLVRYQSFVLLGSGRKIIEAMPLSEFKPFVSADYPGEELVAARAAVSFRFRQTGIVKLVLNVDRSTDTYKFPTVYEPRRRRNVLGARKPSSA